MSDIFVRAHVAGMLVGSTGLGAFLGAATFIPWLWPTAPLTIAVLLHLIFNGSPAKAFWIGHSFGFGLMGASFSWGFGSLPLDWLGIDNFTLGAVIVACIWWLYSIVVGSAVGVFAYIVRIYGKQWSILIFAPFVWVLCEFLHSFLHFLSAWGLGSILGFDLAFGFVGYALAWSDFLWAARIFGVTGLSFLTAFLGTLLFLAWERRKAYSLKISAVVTGTFAGAMILGGYALPAPLQIVYNPPVVEINGLRIIPVSTDIGPALSRTRDELAAIERDVAGAILKATEARPDIIVLPEYIRYFKSEYLLSSTESLRVRQALADSGALLIDSERALPKDGRYGSMLFFDGESGTIVERQHKRLLIPLGEYLPYIVSFALEALGMEEVVRGVLDNRTYTPSHDSFSTRIFEWRGVKLGLLACSESISPFGYKEVSDAGADVLLNVASHAWLRNGSWILFNQTLAMARIHAVYTGKVYVQASNHSPSFVIVPVGASSSSVAQD